MFWGERIQTQRVADQGVPFYLYWYAARSRMSEEANAVLVGDLSWTRRPFGLEVDGLGIRCILTPPTLKNSWSTTGSNTIASANAPKNTRPVRAKRDQPITMDGMLRRGFFSGRRVRESGLVIFGSPLRG